MIISLIYLTGFKRQKTTLANEKLRSLYHKLRRKIDPEMWPDADAALKLWRGLHRTANGSVRPNKFKSDGPLQLTAFFDTGEKAVEIVHEARRHIFDPLVAELRSGLRRHSQEVLDRGLWIPADASLHLIVRVFSEHPSLLDPPEAKQWRPVSDAQVEKLGDAVEAHLKAKEYIDGLRTRLFERAPGRRRMTIRGEHTDTQLP